MAHSGFPLTFVLHQHLQLLPNAIIPACDVHVEGIVTAGFGVCCFVPLLKGSQQAGPGFRNNVVNWDRKTCVMIYSEPKMF